MRPIPEGRLNKKMISVWRISGLVGTILLALLIFAGAVPAIILMGYKAFFLSISVGLCLILFILFVIVLPKLRWARWRYAVLDDEIDIYRGIIVRKRIIVPLIRVQYTDTSQGPFLRAFGLASVNVSTAGGQESIPGLLIGDANELRDRVVNLAKLVHEDV